MKQHAGWGCAEKPGHTLMGLVRPFVKIENWLLGLCSTITTRCSQGGKEAERLGEARPVRWMGGRKTNGCALAPRVPAVLCAVLWTLGVGQPAAEGRV